MTAIAETTQPAVADLATLARSSLAGPASLRSLREAALARFVELGLPTAHHEDWRFTSLSELAATSFALRTVAPKVTHDQVAAFAVPGLASHTLVFVDGIYAPQLSDIRRLPDGVRVTTLHEAFSAHRALVETHLGKIAPFDKDAFAALNTAFAVTHQVLWSLAMLIFLWLQMALRFRAPFWHTLRFRRFQAGERTFAGTLFTFFGLGMALAVAVQLASAFLRTPSKLPIEGMFQTRPSILMMMAAGILVAPLAEELMFRGFLYPVVARKFGVAAGIAVVGSLFGLMHAPQLWGGWGQIALLMLVGMVLTYARARTGSVLASYVLHLGYNSLLLLGFFLATGGLKNLPPPR